MTATPTALPDVWILEPRVFADDRGYFFESWNAKEFRSSVGLDARFVQDNQSHSKRGVLRGLHYQIEQVQGKLIRVVAGRVFDVAVDLRRSSPTFGRWVGCELSDDNRRQIWIPPGFAHGFVALSAHADVVYKATDFYAPQHERCIIWNDPRIGIDWPVKTPILSGKDQAGLSLADAQVFP